jgi:hypothetical protein
MHFEPDTEWCADAGGVMEISRWWSAAKPPERAGPIKNSAPNGAADRPESESRAPPGRYRSEAWFRWFSLPALAPPPANVQCPSGTTLSIARKVHDTL